MNEKRFTLDLEANVDLPILVDTKSGKWWFIRDTVGNCEILCNLLNEIVDENEQLRQGFNELLAVHTKIVETLDSEFVSKALEDSD